MAIHESVWYSPDRHLRITANPAATVITVERDLVLEATFTNLEQFKAFLASQNINLADLIAD